MSRTLKLFEMNVLLGHDSSKRAFLPFFSLQVAPPSPFFLRKQNYWMCKSIIKIWLLILGVKTQFWVVFLFRFGGSKALQTLCPVLLCSISFERKWQKFELNSEQEMSAVSCNYFLRNEPFLNIFWNIAFWWCWSFRLYICLFW